MLIDQQETREAIRRIVFKITPNAALRQDLSQEALIHLWLREKQRPGQTQSWYLQSCRFHLLNYLRNGRSVDSIRRRAARRDVAGQVDLCEEASSEVEGVASDSVVALVSAREIAALLAKWLTPLERRILSCLAEGRGVRETAMRLKISHPTVMRYRRRTAALALRLGIESLPKPNGRHHVRGGSA